MRAQTGAKYEQEKLHEHPLLSRVSGNVACSRHVRPSSLDVTCHLNSVHRRDPEPTEPAKRGSRKATHLSRQVCSINGAKLLLIRLICFNNFVIVSSSLLSEIHCPTGGHCVPVQRGATEHLSPVPTNALLTRTNWLPPVWIHTRTSSVTK